VGSFKRFLVPQSVKTILGAVFAILLTGPTGLAAQNLFGPVKVQNLVYFDGFSGIQLSRDPPGCNNANRLFIDSDFHPDMWELANTAYSTRTNVWVASSGAGRCSLWALATTNIAWNQPAIAGGRRPSETIQFTTEDLLPAGDADESGQD
jgi:hypothetical protein